MNVGETIALGGLVITALGGLAWLGTLTWHGGRQAQKLDRAIDDIRDVKATQGEHGIAIAGWTHVAALLEEVRKDVKAIQQWPRGSRRQAGHSEEG